jgi:REP element-mobilizing transposase RayT
MHADSFEYTQTLAFVIMPDHMHWLFSLTDKASLSEVVGAMKRHSSRQVNVFLNQPGTPIWQRGFHDHALRNDQSVIDVARYIIANPLRAGLVRRVGDWDAVWL